MSSSPSVTFIVATRNEAAHIDACLQAIRSQTYDQEKIEILVPDQSSEDDTRERAARYGAIVTLNPPQRAIFSLPAALEQAKGDIVADCAADNRMDPAYCSALAQAFENPEVAVVFCPVTTDKPGYPLAVRYINRFTDPFNHFVYGDASNPRDLSKRYTPVGRGEGCTLYRFPIDEPPLLAFAQGIAFRAPVRMDQEYPDDVGFVLDMVREGKVFACLDEPLVDHYTAPSLKALLDKFRWRVGKNFARDSSLRWRDRYLSPGRRRRRSLWPLYACSIVAPVAVGIFRAIRDREPLWLYHPVITLAFAWVIGTEALKRLPDAVHLLLHGGRNAEDTSISKL